MKRCMLIAALLVFPVTAQALELLYEGRFWHRAPFPSLDIDGDGLQELGFLGSTADTVQVGKLAGPTLWTFHIDAEDVCPSCDQFRWYLVGFAEVEAAPGREAIVHYTWWSADLQNDLAGFAIVSTTTNAILQNFRTDGWLTYFRGTADFDGNGLEEMVVLRWNWDNPGTEQIWGHSSSGLRGDLSSPSVLPLPNYPNPMSRETSFPLELSVASTVAVEVFDVGGRLVRSLGPLRLPIGRREVTWDGRDHTGHPMASGSYFYEVSVNGVRNVRRLVLAR